MPSKRKRRKKRRPPPNPRAGSPAPETGSTTAEPSAAVADETNRAAARRRGPPDGPPPAPWGSFPLSEIVVLIAIVLLVSGFFTGPPRGAVMLGAGLVLGSLAGLELSARTQRGAHLPVVPFFEQGHIGFLQNLVGRGPIVD